MKINVYLCTEQKLKTGTGLLNTNYYEEVISIRNGIGIVRFLWTS